MTSDVLQRVDQMENMHEHVQDPHRKTETQSETTEEEGEEQKSNGSYILYPWSVGAFDIHTHAQVLASVESPQIYEHRN